MKVSSRLVIATTVLAIWLAFDLFGRSTLMAPVRRMQFVDSQVGWIAGDAGLMKTLDGGLHWTRVSDRFPAGVSRCAVMDAWFVDERVGWAITRDRIVRTIDGGLTWEDQTPENLALLFEEPMLKDWFPYLNRIRFLDSHHGWVAGQAFFGDRGTLGVRRHGFILRTNDGGKSWKSGVLDASIMDLKAIDRQTVWLAGFDDSLRSNDGGESWTEVLLDGKSRLSARALFFWNSQYGWFASVYATIMRTRDGGLSWDRISFEGQWNFYALHFVSRDTGWLVGSWSRAGEYPPVPEAVLMKTRDGGETWNEQFRLVRTRLTPFFIDESKGWLALHVGAFSRRDLSYRLHRTLDGGDSWEMIHEGPTEPCPERP